MTKGMRRRSFVTLALACIALTDAQSATQGKAQAVEISWKDLVPTPTIPPHRANGIVECCDAPDDGTPAPPLLPESKFMSRKRQSGRPAPTVAALDGETVRIGGYVVPLDTEGTAVSSFLLVPFVGACIHVPPPPSNQIILVTASTPFELQGDFDPVFVTGRLQVVASSTDLADTGYAIPIATIERR
jgi:uncharacterized protein